MPAAARSAVAALVLVVPLTLACDAGNRRTRSTDGGQSGDVEPSAPYQSEVEEGLGAAIAILIDNSGSMRQEAPGDGRPKFVVAQEAIEAMLDATDAFASRRPDFPIKIGLYAFSSE